jgi:protein-tyrosine phosphatase
MPQSSPSEISFNPSITSSAEAPWSSNVKTIVFVCIANQNRSPMAEALFRRYLERLGRSDIIVKSAGTSTSIVEGSPVKKNTFEVLLEVSIDISNKKRIFLDEKVMKSATCVILMESDSGLKIAKEYPEARNYFLLNELRPDAKSPDVPDPYGQEGDLVQWQKVLDEIDAALPDLLDFIDNPNSEIARFNSETGVLERTRPLVDALRPFALNKVKEIYASYTQKLEAWNQTNAQSVSEIVDLKRSVSYWEDDFDGELADAIKLDQEWSLDLLHDEKYGLKTYSEELLNECDQIKEACRSCRERFEKIGLELEQMQVAAQTLQRQMNLEKAEQGCQSSLTKSR